MSRRLLAVVGAALVTGALVAAAPARAQDAAAEPLGRLDAIRAGVERNQGLLSERLAQRRAEAFARAAWRPWSPQLRVGTGWTRPYAGSGKLGADRLGYEAGVAWLSPVGTRVEAGVAMDQGLPGTATSPHESRVGVDLEQALLRDGWLSGAGLPLAEARLASRLQNELFRAELNTFLVDVDDAYWDLALAQDDLEIKTRSLARAKGQYDDTVENIRRGILAESEVYVVEENLVIFEAEHVRAEERLRVARRRVARLLRMDAGAPIAAVDRLELGAAALPDRARIVADAARASPRVLAQRARLELAQERVRFHFNQALPALGLRTGVGVHGASDDYGAAWTDLATRPVLDARVGASLEVPLDFGALAAQLQTAELEASREEAELARQEDEVRFEVEDALGQLATDLALAGNAQRQVKLAELKLQAEMEKYKSGLSTLTDVVRFQRDVDDASIAAKRVVRQVRVGEARLLARVGTLHEALGVSWEEP
jgi:outer membrane protein TolC